MNITQIMRIYNWEISEMIKIPTSDCEALIERIGIAPEYLTIIEYTGSNVYPTIIFNSMTSEVLFIHIFCDDEESDNCVYYANGIAVPEYDSSVVVSEDTMLKLLSESIGKEPDELVTFDIDDTTIVQLDSEAASRNITRSDFVVDILIKKIMEMGSK